MTTAQEIINLLMEAADNPKAQLEHYLNQGKKVVGCFPVYCPEELVHASGMIPMGLWGARTELDYAKKYLPAFACPIMQSTLELALRGKYDGLSAVIIPTLCDTFRCISQDWSHGIKNIPMIPVTYPQNRKFAGSTDFLISEYEIVLARLSILTGMRISDDRLDESIAIYNRHNEVMREFAAVANDHLDVITPTVRHAVFKSAFFIEKSEHTTYVRRLIDALNDMPKYDFRGTRVILTGILAEPGELLKILEDNNMAVVGDDLAQEMRQYRTDIPEKGGTAIRRLALQWNAREGCCLAHEDFKKRGELLINLVRQNKASGVIYCQMKFCDPEEYDYPICERELTAENIPVLQIEIDQLSTSFEQLRTRIQTFAEIIG